MEQTAQPGTTPAPRARARALGIAPGILAPGPLNAITDVAGVLVGHVTLIEGDDIRTGATAILPHDGNLFQERAPAGLAVANGFGKLMGATQVKELGEIETPLVLTNTLAIARAAEAIDAARPGPVQEGAVGAGTGTVAFGWKGGIGTSSRLLPASLCGYSLGVLVQTNYGGVLQIDGLPVGRALGRYYLRDELDHSSVDGSIMIVIATDAPLSDRNLTRLARRAFAGVARTGASFSNGSGDYAIALSTAQEVRRTRERRSGVNSIAELPNDLLTPLFQAAIEATEEAIYNSLLMAEPMCGYQGHCVEALPIDDLQRLLQTRWARASESPGGA